MKRATTIATCVLLAVSAAALPVDRQRAAQAAKTFWQSRTGHTATLVDRTAEWPYAGMYLFTNPDGGFVLVSADDAARPILGYSLTAPMPVSGQPESLRRLMQGYSSQIASLRSDATASPRNAETWRQLDAGTLPAARKDAVVGPLLTTMWDQGAPYNEQCPGEGSARCATGCVATAEAMLLKYWNYPTFGVGSHSYEEHEYGTLTADFAHTVYNWEMMFDRPNAYSIPEAREAIATLMYHCGVSVEMYYRTADMGGSGAVGISEVEGTASTNQSLIKYFHYNPDMQVIRRANFTSDEQWRDTIIGELRQLHPVLYDGADLQGGHAFVCDGFDDELLLHFNFGWSGGGNGYFPVDDISPRVGGIGSNPTGTFTLDNVALLGAYPDPRPLINQRKLYYDREAVEDSVWVSFTDSTAEWTVTSNAEWLTVEHDDFSKTGTLHYTLTANNSGAERMATVTVSQGGLSSELEVVQSYYGEEDRCDLTVTMLNNGPSFWGWRSGCYLTVESQNGLVYAKLQMASGDGSEKAVDVRVDPHDVLVVWHPGNTSMDNLVGYKVTNLYDETLIDVPDATQGDERYLLSWPCTHVGIDEAGDNGDGVESVYPNPTTGQFRVDGAEVRRVTVTDLNGRRVRTFDGDGTMDISDLPAAVYFLHIETGDGMAVRRIVKK